MMTIPLVSLPLPLILLVHLHILEYPQANKTEYDHDLFNPRVRGLRDRTRSMEDIFYFLVGRLEGGRNSAKSILPTYPCLQPSETVAFRTSLSKYLEALRHQSLYPSTKTTLNGGRGMASTTVKEADGLTAWWWKDVVVRKSLLEECAGEKFERLLVSVSTHVLLKNSTALHPAKITNVFRTQPAIYTALSLRCQSSHQSWSRQALSLLQRKSDLQLLREHLTAQKNSQQSRYEQFPVEKLVALVDSMYRDLLEDQWCGADGRKALDMLLKLAGLSTAISSENAVLPSWQDEVSDSLSSLSTANSKLAPVQPLPVAAAHHPSHLRRLKRSVFQTSIHAAPKAIGSASTTPRQGHAHIILSKLLEAEKRMNAALLDARSRNDDAGEQLKKKLQSMMSRGTLGLEKPSCQLKLWTPPCDQLSIEPDRTPDAALLATFGLSDPTTEASIDTRIDHVREILLPSYPPVQDPSQPRLPTDEPEYTQTRISRIPTVLKSTSNGLIAMQSSTPPRELATSTPPPTVKPPSEYVKSIKKSARFSVARMKRPSMFVFKNAEYDEVDQIIHGTEDTSTELSPSQLTPMSFRTPKKRPAINRIWTSGSAKPKSTAKKARETPRESFPLETLMLEPAVSLPSLMLASSSSSFGDVMNSGLTDDKDSSFGVAGQDGQDDSWSYAGISNTPTGAKQGIQSPSNLMDELSVQDYTDTFEEEGHSMTLRDILLQADTSHYDFLNVQEGDGLLQTDESFVWG